MSFSRESVPRSPLKASGSVNSVYTSMLPRLTISLTPEGVMVMNLKERRRQASSQKRFAMSLGTRGNMSYSMKRTSVLLSNLVRCYVN